MYRKHIAEDETGHAPSLASRHPLDRRRFLESFLLLAPVSEFLSGLQWLLRGSSLPDNKFVNRTRAALEPLIPPPTEFHTIAQGCRKVSSTNFAATLGRNRK